MIELAASITTIVGGLLLVFAAIYLLPVGLSALSVARHGAQRAQRLDESDAAPADIARSGGRTLLALFIVLGSFGLVLIVLVLQVAAGIPFEQTTIVLILRFLLNLILNPFGYSV